MTFANQTIDEFLGNVASANITPSGGAVAAIGGAAGAALCEMVCIHTLRQGSDSNVEQELTSIRTESSAYRQHLVELADEDSVVVNELQNAFNLPHTESHDKGVQKAMKRATDTPLKIAEACLEIIELSITVSELCNQNATADVGTGASLAYGAFEASIHTVQSNLQMLDDDAYVGEMSARSNRLEDSAERKIAAVVQNVSN